MVKTGKKERASGGGNGGQKPTFTVTKKKKTLVKAGCHNGKHHGGEHVAGNGRLKTSQMRRVGKSLQLGKQKR